MDQDFIQQFTQMLLVEAGLNEIPEDFRNIYIQQLSYELQRRIGILAIKALDPPSYRQFQALIRERPDQDLFSVLDFFKARLPNFNDIVVQALFEIKCEIIDKASELKKC